MSSARTISGKAAIVGVHESPVRNAPDTHPFAILADCVHRALADAGLSIEDVDGLCVAQGDLAEGGAAEDVIEVAEYLGIRPTYLDSTDIGGASYLAMAGRAAAAIASGLAEVVIIAYPACPRNWPIQGSLDAATFPAGPGQFDVPYGPTLVSNYAMIAQRHMHDYGTTSEQLAAIAIQCRANASLNPHARFTEPLTIEDVITSPLVASPFHRFDCCVVTDGGAALVMTSVERARDLPSQAITLQGYGEAVTAIQLSQMPSLTVTPASVSGRRAFAMADLKPSDVDVAQLYDALTITPLLAIEDLGFCAKGEGGPFVAEGNIAPGGVLPINTDGGGLSSNHPGKRGLIALVEAVRQLRGESPGVTIPGAEIALVHGWGGFMSSAATVLLSR